MDIAIMADGNSQMVAKAMIIRIVRLMGWQGD
jgi:hypothetical protein